MPPRSQNPAAQQLNADGLALPPEASAASAGNGDTVNLAVAPADIANPEIATRAALANGMSGEMVKVILAEGEGQAGKDAQFVRVNDQTWLVPRNNEAVIPVEAYRVLNDTQPPIPEGMSPAAYAKRFSVSIIERYPAQRQAA